MTRTPGRTPPGRQPSPAEREVLRKHHLATWGLFIAFWIFAPAAILAIEVLPLSDRSTSALIGTIFGAAIVAGLLQFSARCPSCRANLGRQRGVGVPECCTRCGARLRP